MASLPSSSAAGAARSRARERGIGRASIALGTTTDSYQLRFSRDLRGVVDLVAVGAVGARTLGHLVFAIAEPGTRPERDAGGARYTVRLRAVASDAGGRPFANLDTTIVFRPSAPLGPAQYLIGRAELPLPRGRWTWRAALQVGDSTGIVLPRDTLRVDPSMGGLSLSDLALGIRGASAVWEPTFVARTTSRPEALIVAPATSSPGPTSTGTGSPVSIDRSTAEKPSSTIPSVAIFSPGRTTNRSPATSSSTGTTTSWSSRSTRASLALSSKRARIAALERYQ